ncbi:uncharacterized protein Dwil_GK25087 [Drosophila willistoni]|uniref:BTB domain-containing protein n=1 Tax=Drosophila willistoni TaxID=7260 RepID=A0A0Q9WTW5_DROWI|nr:uncharacterized protein Dwil_GK25087 [Drosophila willistoni]
MGSEHYCLRWNNHQSNLLGVFSQLLQDESLVDVTLACSEGTSIRAHKVVLSASSSYFRSLFLEHPERHPIVILKDVRFAELQTLVEYMYKGEVNVQYCQLSALLKTAESLKVKGLAEMTNQNTTSREPEREPDRLRPHSQATAATSAGITGGLVGGGPSKMSDDSTTVLDATAASATTSYDQDDQVVVHRRENVNDNVADVDEDEDAPMPLDLYQRRAASTETLPETIITTTIQTAEVELSAGVAI